MLVHEMTHAWVFYTYGNDAISHGKEFRSKMTQNNNKKELKFINVNKPTTLEIPPEFWIASNKNKQDTRLIR